MRLFSCVALSLFAATTAFGAPAPAENKNNMQNCPSAVDGAVTSLKDVPGGIELTITGKGDVTAQVRARAKALAEASKAAARVTKHDAKGDGGGRTGRCPVVMYKTTTTSADVEGGVALTVKADDANDVAWLRKETHERVQEVVATSGGHGKMAHCPSALDGANTTVTDTKDGVLVLVTGKGELVKAIRARTSELVAAAAASDAAVGHAGNGQGGGAFGRCPVVVSDTVVSAKDVEGGAQITVNAKAPAGVAALQKESHARADRLAPAPAAPLAK